MRKILLFALLIISIFIIYTFLDDIKFYLHEIIKYLVNLVHDWGYFGIFALMFLESSFFPFPSEVVMIPAGYLAFNGKLSLVLAIFYGTLGSLFGALFNYFLAYKFGRKLILKFGKYFFITEDKFAKFELFFNKHGEISTFTCRLIPGIRQYISLPAGLSLMSLTKFSLYTSLGAGIWVSILAFLGYFLGENEALIKEYLHIITISLVIFVAIIFIIYIKFQQKRRS